MSNKIRNIAIIAHVDHGKTTLIDSIMKQCGNFRENERLSERLMDSGVLEKERGITILAKPTSIMWSNTRINIIDTPGHVDFGGEVERVLDMTDGVILLIDASEGPMPQTKFVLDKALKQNLLPIVIINKIDKHDSRPDEVLNEVFDLFVSLQANDAQLDFPVLYASGRSGWCSKELNNKEKNLNPLLDLILHHVPPPIVEINEPFAMLVTLLESDPYLGRCLIGKVRKGKACVNDYVKTISLDGKNIELARLTKLLRFEGTSRVPVEEVSAGDIICVAGFSKASVSDTLCAHSISTPISSTPIDPPTMSITISVNDSPLAGLEGTKVTSTIIRERLISESESNIAITYNENKNKDSFDIGGRGELQLGVLIETMRREGFELSVSRPRVLFKTDNTGKILEPMEEIIIDVDDKYINLVIDGMNRRKAEVIDMNSADVKSKRLIFLAPSRGLIGYQSRFLRDTRGTGVMNRLFHSYDSFKGEIINRRKGALIATEKGIAVAYALFNLQERGTMFIAPQTQVYQGMIVGEHNKQNDLAINVLKGKKLTNIRASGSDKAIILTPPRIMSIEDMMTYINEDELLEITPLNLRLRKKILSPSDRKKML